MAMIYLILALIIPTYALTGYDCGGQHLNVTSISLLGAGECDLTIKTTNNTDTYIQLLQLSDYNYAEVIQCKVEIIRTVHYCGMHSHVSVVNNGLASYIEETSYERCKNMQNEGTAKFGDTTVSGLQPNRTNTRSFTLAGTVDFNGKCKGASYNDPYGNFQDVVVQATARIILLSSYVPVHLSTGKIHLNSGTTCDLKDGKCYDPDHGHSFWKSMPVSSCDFHQYDVLYEGKARKTQDDTLGTHPPVVYSLTTQDITFALMTAKAQQLCGYVVLSTEHPKLFIIETRKGDTPKPHAEIPVDNLDIFTYVNSKFVYVEKHIKNQMTSLYYNVIKQRCELEQEVLKNTLSLATLLPDEFAYRLMKEPGYTAVTAGEAIHIIKCIPVEVTIRRPQECYTEIPVMVRNTSYFLTPKSRILTKYGTQRECSQELPTLYLIEDTWVQFTPNPQVRQIPPQRLQPMTKISWKYLTPGPLAVSGIYTQQDIEKLRDHIMFPAEKPALLNSIARGITGYSTGDNTASMYDLLNEDALNKIAENTASRLWRGFVTFGSATAGVFGIFVIIRLTKLIIDTAIHGYALHMAYGCSLHLLGALWSSLTHLLLHLARGPLKRRPPTNNDDPKDDQPNQPKDNRITVVTSQPINSNTVNNTLPTYTNLQPYNSPEYRDLSRRIAELEQIPTNTSGVCS